MITYSLRLTESAERDLEELHGFLLLRDPLAADRALEALRASLAVLERFPFTCRKNETANDPTLRELLVPFGRGGYVVLFRISNPETVTVLAVRHQREDDYR